MRTSADQPRRGTPGADIGPNVRALLDRWTTDAERYQKYAGAGPNPEVHRAIATTLTNAAHELNGALAQDRRDQLLREAEAEWNQLQAKPEWSQLQAEAQAEWNQQLPAADADGSESRNHP